MMARARGETMAKIGLLAKKYFRPILRQCVLSFRHVCAKGAARAHTTSRWWVSIMGGSPAAHLVGSIFTLAQIFR